MLHTICRTILFIRGKINVKYIQFQWAVHQVPLIFNILIAKYSGNEILSFSHGDWIWVIWWKSQHSYHSALFPQKYKPLAKANRLKSSSPSMKRLISTAGFFYLLKNNNILLRNHQDAHTEKLKEAIQKDLKKNTTHRENENKKINE